MTRDDWAEGDPINILLVEDSPADVDLTREALDDAKVRNTLHVVSDGVAALEAIEKYRPEVVLLDIGLPRLDCHAVCRRVREQPWGKDIVIIALTGWGQEDDRRKSEAAGFNGHLVKPVDYDKLLELLSSLTARSATRV